MAEITQDVKTVTPTSYIGLSKEPDRVRPNTGFGELFKGIGSLAEGAITAIDEKNKEDISNSIYGGVDDIQKEMGVDAAAEAGAAKTPLFTGNENNTSVNPAVAENIERSSESLARLKTALEQGKITQMYYAQRSEALVRNLRAQYPGYREFIDDKVSKITGMKPANAIIREINSVIEAKKSSAQQNAEREKTFIRGKLEHLSPEEREEAINGGWDDPQKRAKYTKSIGDREGMISNIQVQKAALELKAKMGAAVDDEAIGYLQNYSHNMTNLQLDKAYRELDPLLKGLREGQTLSPDQVMKVRAAVQALKTEAIKQFDTELATGFGEDKKNFLQRLPPAKVKELKDQLESRFSDIIETIEKGDFSMLKANSTFTKMQIESDSRKIVGSEPSIRAMASVKELLGQEGVKFMLPTAEAQVKFRDNVQRAVETFIKAEFLQKDGNLGDTIKGLKKLDGQLGVPTTKTKAAMTQVFTDTAKKLADKNVDPAFLEKFVTQVFGSGESTKAWTEYFVPEERQAIFKMFTSPDIIKNLEKIKGTEAAKHVQLFIERSARANLQTSADSITDKITEPNGAVGIQIDPQTGRLRAVQTRKLTEQERQLGGRFGNNPSSAITPSFQRQVDLMNENLEILSRQYKAMGLDPKVELKAFLQAVGINENNPRRASVWQKMINEMDGGSQDGNPAEVGGTPIPNPPDSTGAIQRTPTLINPANMGSRPDQPMGIGQIESYVEKRAKEIGRDLGVSRDDFLDTNAAISLMPNAKFDGEEEEYVSLKADRSGADYSNLTATTKEQAILNVVASAESGKNGYNKIFGGKTMNLTSMSVGDVLTLQRQMINVGSPSSALGRYQFINKTLKGLISDLGIPVTATFNEELQDKLAVALLKRRGWDKFKAGRMTEDQFLDSLAKEWAGLPNTKGVSHYAGDGLNRATITLDKVRKALQFKESE
jgi:muramidase (phage lysozyme)